MDNLYIIYYFSTKVYFKKFFTKSFIARFGMATDGRCTTFALRYAGCSEGLDLFPN
jgi:hypothetical protein